MISNKHVEEYIKLFHTNKIKLNKERIMLLAHLQKNVLSRDDLYFNEEMIESYISFTETFYFKLEPFQKFIAAFVFLFDKEDDAIFYEQFFITMSRGSGKNGFASSLAHFCISPFHGIPKYNVSIVANTEKQAKVSFEEIYDVIDENDSLSDHFYKTKVEILGLETKSIIQYHTSSGKKDGLRDGMVLYDEVHMMENWDVINVFSSGLGKVPNSREVFIGTNGFYREGVYDQLQERAMNILEGREEDDPMFPFICKIDEKDEIDNPEMWEKACPMFSEPRSTYAKGLYKKVKTQYKQLPNNPSNRAEFMTKRMNMPEVNLSTSVALWEDIMETNKEFPDLEHKSCIGGLDYADMRDFCAVGLLFRDDDDYVWLSHSFARKEFLKTAKLKVPIEEWEEKGLLTVLDEPSIGIKHVINWFSEMREKYDIKKIVADSYRLDLVRSAFEEAGFELEVIKRPVAIHPLLAPRIETAFSNHNIIFGDNPLMRWYTGNVYVHIRKDGNKEFLKKDENRRKTDGFHAFLHSLYRADEILDTEIELIDYEF
ncbi:terminase TerL endonuclease subunit [Priestia megaterium]|uniref:terminase TerL endonuclease subunit n=1 Tax=Priestia megaterium TaxID=1404 RepID=UPI000BFDAA30|nr:terminase TerL endonuclease subunit [Priestia megaterium]PGR01343.1 terminase [Priestia megaterium]